MKKKILLIIAGGFIAGIAMINTKIELAERNMNVSISDISVMALADGEYNPCPGWDGWPYCQWDSYWGDCYVWQKCGSICLGGC